jgi:hypothetical protein
LGVIKGKRVKEKVEAVGLFYRARGGT